MDSQAACLILEDFYQARAYKAEIVWPDPGVEPLRASPPKGSSNSEGRAEDGAAAAGGTAVGAGGAGAGGAARTHMSYDVRAPVRFDSIIDWLCCLDSLYIFIDGHLIKN